MTDVDLDSMRAERNRQMDRARRKRNQLAALRGIPTGNVDAAPIRVRLKALTDLGWSYEAIAAMHGDGTAAALGLIARGTSRQAHRKFAGIARMPVTLAVPDSVPDNCWVPALGVARRIRALLALGWRHPDIEEYAGRSVSVFAGTTCAPTKVRAIDWRMIAAAYDLLSTAPGLSERTRLRAITSGYAPPLAWDDIDDPQERPKLDRRPVTGLARWARIVEDYDHLIAQGESEATALARVGVQAETVRDYRRRLERAAG